MKALIVIAKLKKDKKNYDSEIEAQELSGLCLTSGFNPARIEKIYISRINPSLYIGEGKAEEIKNIMEKENFSIAVFSQNLTSAQQKNLEEITGKKIIDRTLLILNIFEQRANSPEGKIQVKLARAKYEMTRIYGKGLSMDQQVGMVGTRGSGEKIAEYQKRELKTSLARINKELKRVKEERQTQREKRRSIPLAQVSIAGYTNSGKSSLLSSLTEGKHNIYSDDRLFATLDPLTRRVRMPSGYHILFSDTVGFISDLPTFLVASFKSTLEEIRYSDLIIHLKDISNPNWQYQSACVEKILNEIGAGHIPVLQVFNKTDCLSQRELRSLLDNPLYKDHVFISALNSSGIKTLLERIEKIFRKIWKQEIIFLPHEKSFFIGNIEKMALIEKRVWTSKGVELTIVASSGNMDKIKSSISA